MNTSPLHGRDGDAARATHPLTASLVIPSYKGETKLPTLLAALEKQDAPHGSWEALVVIDGLFDDSPALIEAAREQGVPVRAVVLEENQGRVAALNAGFAAATGDVLIRCDDDLEPAASYVSSHLARHAHAAQPIGVVGIYRDILPHSRYSSVYGHPREQKVRQGAYAANHPSWKYWAGNCSVTRETYDRLGGYSTAYVHYGWEDVDFGYRLHEIGVPVILAPELETIHHGAAISTVTRTLRAYHSGAARRTFDAQHPGVVPAPSAGSGWWGRLVSAVAAAGAEEQVETRARLTDHFLPFLPSALGEKLVALNVESASLAGYEHAHTVTNRF
nr:glycosyltransferase family A protein [Actinomyces sp.]